METEKQYYLINEKGEYFIRNEFNAKAYFLSAKQNDTPPVTAFCRGEWEINKKKKYLEERGSGFTTLELKEYEKPI